MMTRMTTTVFAASLVMAITAGAASASLMVEDMGTINDHRQQDGIANKSVTINGSNSLLLAISVNRNAEDISVSYAGDDITANRILLLDNGSKGYVQIFYALGVGSGMLSLDIGPDGTNNRGSLSYIAVSNAVQAAPTATTDWNLNFNASNSPYNVDEDLAIGDMIVSWFGAGGTFGGTVAANPGTAMEITNVSNSTNALLTHYTIANSAETYVHGASVPGTTFKTFGGSVKIEAIPEPASVALFGLGGLLMLKRRAA